MTSRAERLRETLAVLDVGHGNSAVLFSGDDVAVFDTGTGSGLLEFLRQQGVDHVKTVFLSHADQDHIGGLVGLLAAETVTVERVVLNTDSSKESATWDDLLYKLDARNRAGRTVLDTSITAGDSESFGAVTATAAAPSPYLSAKGPGGRDRSGRKITSNSISAVIRLATAAGPIALLTGDLDLVGLEDLERADGDVTAPILVFPHHGGGTGSADVPGYVTRLIERAHPRVVVFSIGRRREGSPTPRSCGIFGRSRRRRASCARSCPGSARSRSRRSPRPICRRRSRAVEATESAAAARFLFRCMMRLRLRRNPTVTWRSSGT